MWFLRISMRLFPFALMLMYGPHAQPKAARMRDFSRDDVLDDRHGCLVDLRRNS
jgi:hypothetical protein